jgi:DNA-directed RNA polymerase subunit RPC12/RpoP
MVKLTEILQDILAEKKLCPKGKAYYNRRRAAGEKPSAYLSGRAVKVCKGLMEEDDLDMHESLRDWFKKEDWVRIDTAGNITGPCGTMKKGNKTTRCLPRAKANSLSKEERAATSKKKAASDKQFVPNTKKAKVHLSENEDQTIECEKCGWKWELEDGGNDPYICHKCGFNNSDQIDEYDVENEQDLKEFVTFIKEYKQVLSEGCDCLLEAEYHGHKVQLGKIMQGDIKKFKVYVKNNKGKVVKVNFGFGGKSAHGKRMVIKAKNPKRRAAYRARHNCDNPGPRWKANYWSCKKW